MEQKKRKIARHKLIRHSHSEIPGADAACLKWFHQCLKRYQHLPRWRSDIMAQLNKERRAQDLLSPSNLQMRNLTVPCPMLHTATSSITSARSGTNSSHDGEAILWRDWIKRGEPVPSSLRRRSNLQMRNLTRPVLPSATRRLSKYAFQAWLIIGGTACLLNELTLLIAGHLSEPGHSECAPPPPNDSSLLENQAAPQETPHTISSLDLSVTASTIPINGALQWRRV